MSSELQLDVRHLNRWRRHLVNAYEVRQAWCLLQVKLCDPCLSALKWSLPCKALYRCSALPLRVGIQLCLSVSERRLPVNRRVSNLCASLPGYPTSSTLICCQEDQPTQYAHWQWSILEDCPNLRDIWHMYFTASSLTDTFTSVDNQSIIDWSTLFTNISGRQYTR